MTDLNANQKCDIVEKSAMPNIDLKVNDKMSADSVEANDMSNVVPKSRTSKSKRAWAIVGTVALIVGAIVAAAVLAGGANPNSNGESNGDGNSNMMNCAMAEMVPMDGFSMGPVQFDIANNAMMTMESMELACMTEGQESALYMKMSSEKNTMDSGATQTVWHGAMTGERMGFATFVQNDDGVLSGSFTTEDAAYSLMQTLDGTTQMKMTLWGDFPAEADTEDDTNNSNTTDVVQGDVALDVEASFVPITVGNIIVSNEKDVTGNQISGPAGRFLRQQQESRSLQSSARIDVLVIVTNRAQCEFVGLRAGCTTTFSTRAPFNAKIAVLEQQSTNAMQGVGVNAETRIVDTVYLAPGFDGGPDSSTLDVIRSNGNIAQWRRESGADLVAVITGSGQYCGIAGLNSFASATSHTCLDGFTFTHELGHNMGARHHPNDSGRQHPYGHGYRNGQFRTIMAYNCPGGSCARIPYFSANGYALSGQSIGTPSEDNARLLRENTPATARWNN